MISRFRKPCRLPVAAIVLGVLGCAQEPPDAAAGLAEAEALYHEGRHAEAYEAFDRLRRQVPERYEPYDGLTRSAIELGRPAAAVPALEERVARGGPETYLYHLLLGTLQERANRWLRAEEQYRAALELEDYPLTYLKLSMLLARWSRRADALEIARRGVEKFPGDGELRAWYGRVYAGSRRWQDAERELREAIRLLDGDAAPHRTLGIVYLNAGRPADARRELEIAAELEPGSHQAWYQLAHACELLGDLEARDRALETFTEVLRRLAPAPGRSAPGSPGP